MKKSRLTAVILCLAMVFSLTGCSAGDYKSALALAESGDWAGAREVFAALGDYKDAAAKVDECDYEIAGIYMADGNYDEAISLFEALGDYKDSADMISECKYQKALSLLENSEFYAAEELFTELGGYKDSSEQIDTCIYQKAVSLYDAGSFEEALVLFAGVPTYEQADHYCVLCWLQCDPNGFVDLFVDSMNMLYAAAGLDMVLEENIASYERDSREFCADFVPDYHEILLCFNCDDADGYSHADGQINNITVIGDTYDVNDMENIYEEFLYSAAFATCVLDDASMLDAEGTAAMISDSFTRILSGFTGTEDYTEQEYFDYNGYECASAVIFWPGDEGIYRFIFSITVPELVS